MHKKSLLLSTATAAIVLFSPHLNVHAETLSVTGEQDPKVVSGKPYQAENEKGSAISATAGGKIDGTKLTLTGKGSKGTGASASGSGSMIDLKDTIINQVATGLKTEDSGEVTMTGGIIEATGVAVSAETNGVVILNDVLITSEKQGLTATGGAHITVNGSSINAGKIDESLDLRNDKTIIAVEAAGESVITITLNDEDKILSDGTGLSAKDEKTIITITGGTINAAEMAVAAENKGAVILNQVAVESEDRGLFVRKEAQITMNGGSIDADVAVKAQYNGTITLNNAVTIKSQNKGLSADKEAQITMNGGSIDAGKTAVEAVDKSIIKLNNGVKITSKEQGLFAEGEESKITMVGGKVSGKHAVYVKDGGQIALANVTVISKQGDGLLAEGKNTKITMTGGQVTAIAGDNFNAVDGVAFHVREGGHIDAINVLAVADKVGLELFNENNKVNFTNTKIIVKDGVGIQLTKIPDDSETDLSQILKEEGQLSGVSGEQPKTFDNTITLKNSEIRSDILLNTTSEANAILTSDHSILEGGTRVGDQDNIIFNLNNGSKWILKTSKKEADEDGLLDISKRSRSDISMLNLNDSSVIFDGPTEGHYQTLQVGWSDVPETKAVYNAKGNTKLYLNAEWSDGKKIEKQKADHLLIKGGVSGATTVYVNTKGSAAEENVSLPWNERGISLIQVSGKAEKNSFKLANGYTTIGGSPYKYTLNAYGPKSSNGLASVDQMLFEKDPAIDDQSTRVDDIVDNKGNDFWDFRLQNQYLANSNVKALAPQMANYLVMPSALFSTGFTDIENQNALLTNLRAAMPWAIKNDKQNPFFLSTYGSKATLSSNRTALEYGYGADIGYAAIQTGVALAPLEGQNISSYFGLLGTYGKLSFTPQNMVDVDKTVLEKWGITAYSSVQHNGGVYLNAFLSYGFLKGNVFNAVVGRTAKLDDANTWSASAILGKKLATNVEGLVFEPQMQIAYQQLLLGNIQDADNFKVDIGNPHQWTVRMGGRLTKNVNRVEDGHLFSFYGKLNLISTFGDEGTIRVGDSFRLDPMGSAIEGGVGVNAQLFQNIALHGDISYQQKLQKAGVSGATLSGGLKYRF
ncbi:autotransporter outer membrane beta-barrel domain-containing protein [Helicobacter pylori]